jgi:alpha-N-arabinofuranosidase
VHHVSDLGPFSLLDATATCDKAAGTLTLAVVNRDKDQSHKATIDLGGAEVAGGLQVSEVTGPDVGSTNSFEQPNLVGVRERQVDAKGGRLDYEFPARSVSVLRMRLR